MQNALKINADGSKEWSLNGTLHREDGPAVEWPSGRKEWYLNGLCHREEGPAIESADGSKEWWYKGIQVCRAGIRDEALWTRLTAEPLLDGLLVGLDGTKYWHRNDLLHREDGPALEKADGSKMWYQNDILHREDGPAVERPNGSKYWYLNGILHREDGPAVEWRNRPNAWYLHGKFLGRGSEGFWALWSQLSNEQRADLNLLKHLPK